MCVFEAGKGETGFTVSLEGNMKISTMTAENRKISTHKRIKYVCLRGFTAAAMTTVLLITSGCSEYVENIKQLTGTAEESVNVTDDGSVQSGEDVYEDTDGGTDKNTVSPEPREAGVRIWKRIRKRPAGRMR